MLTLFNLEISQKRGQIGQSCPKDIVPFLAVFYYQTSCPIFGRTQFLSVVLAPLWPRRPTASLRLIESNTLLEWSNKT